MEEAQEGLAKLLEDQENASSTHMIYAYRGLDEGENLIEGNSDDGEHGASRILLRELRKADVLGLVVLFRYYGGKNLGAKRFKIFESHAAKLVELILAKPGTLQ